MSYFPPPSEPDPEKAFRPASADEATGPLPEADEPTLTAGEPVSAADEPTVVTGEPVPAADEPTRENAVVHAGKEPVFVDTSGRRRTALRRIGIGIGTLALAYLALFVVSLAGGPRPPGIPLPEAVAGDPDRTQTEPDGTTPATEPTPSGSPASTAGAGSGGAPAATAGPTRAVPPGAAVPSVPAPPVATPAPTTPAPTTTPPPTTPPPTPAVPSPLVTGPAPAVDPTEPAEP